MTAALIIVNPHTQTYRQRQSQYKIGRSPNRHINLIALRMPLYARSLSVLHALLGGQA